MKTEKSEQSESLPIEAKTANTTRVKKLKALQTETFSWGKREFGIISKSFEGETKEVQDTMIGISTMLQVVKLNLSEQPAVIVYLLKKHLPTLGELAVLGNLGLGIEGLCHTGYDDSLVGFLTTMVERTANMTDAQWNNFWDGMFKGIAAPLLPWPKICSYAPYVYNVLVKPNVR
jgi:hypothetical protein